MKATLEFNIDGKQVTEDFDCTLDSNRNKLIAAILKFDVNNNWEYLDFLRSVKSTDAYLCLWDTSRHILGNECYANPEIVDLMKRAKDRKSQDLVMETIERLTDLFTMTMKFHNIDLDRELE